MNTTSPFAHLSQYNSTTKNHNIILIAEEQFQDRCISFISVHFNGSSLCVNFTMNNQLKIQKQSVELTANSLLTGSNKPAGFSLQNRSLLQKSADMPHHKMPERHLEVEDEI